MIKFSICHATDRIPTGWRRAIECWKTAADYPETVEHVLCTKQPLKVDPIFPVTRLVTCPESRGSVDQWNRSAEASTGEILIMVADDLFPPIGWDTALLNAIFAVIGGGEQTAMSRGKLELPAVAFDVGYTLQNPCYPLIAHVVITRSLYRSFGYLHHPDYIGLMADQEFTDVMRRGLSVGVLLNCPSIEFRHLNPDKGTAEWDDVYRKHRSQAALKIDQETYFKRQALGFPKESISKLVGAPC